MAWSYTTPCVTIFCRPGNGEFGLQGTTLSPLGRGVKYKNILPCLTETLISPVIITIRRLLVPPELLNQPHCNCCLAQLLPLPCPSPPLTYCNVIAAHVSFHSSLLIKSICKETGSDSPRSTAAPAAYLPTWNNNPTSKSLPLPQFSYRPCTAVLSFYGTEYSWLLSPRDILK